VGEEGRQRAFLPEEENIWIPPGVDIKEVDRKKLGLYYREESEEYPGDKILCITYPVPDNLQLPLVLDPLKDEHYQLDFTLLEDIGWKREGNTRGLINEFLHLSNASPPHRIASFALKWGPLWSCVGHEKDDQLGEHTLSSFFNNEDCQWYPAEPIDVWQYWAEQINAIFDLASYLLNGQPAPRETWERVYGDWCDDLPDYRTQKLSFTSYINDKILNGAWENNGIYLKWPIQGKPSLEIKTGFGFISKVWMQVAQIITGTPGFYICDGCGRTYIRTSRKAAVGKRNYCPECGEGKKGAKRVYARSKRG